MSQSFERRLKQVGILITVGLTIALAIVARVIQPANEPPLEVARGAAQLLALLGAIGVLLFLLHAKLPRRIAGIRVPRIGLLSHFYASSGGGWLPLLAGGLAVLLLKGNPDPARLQSVFLLMALAAAAMLWFALALSLIAFLASSRLDQLVVLAMILAPALFFATLTFYVSVAAWRAAHAIA